MWRWIYRQVSYDAVSKIMIRKVKKQTFSFACDIGGNPSLCFGGAVMIPIEIIERYDREMDRKTRQNMERFAEFMARMIEKYGKKVLAEIEKEEAEQQKEQEEEGVDYFE